MVEFTGLLILVPIWTLSFFVVGTYVTACLLAIHVVVVPLIFKYSKTFRRHLIFANFVQWPLFMDLQNPSSRGIDGARNLSIEYHSKVDNCSVKIGIWHILPKSAHERLRSSLPHQDLEVLERAMHAELANANTPVILYCHGNSNSRGASHRIKLYRFFQEMDFHTIAFDYRGYGDSTRVRPTEAGVVEDALVVYDWIRSLWTPGHAPPLFVWGHSLGTGISSNFLGNLEELSKQYLNYPPAPPVPNGLILEAPFNNLADEVKHHPLSKLVTWLPYYDTTFVEPFRKETEFRFESDSHLAKQPKLPILILHAKDDIIVPFIVGLKLYSSIEASRGEGDACLKMEAYDSALNLGHKYIVNAANLQQVIGDFINTHR